MSNNAQSILNLAGVRHSHSNEAPIALGAWCTTIKDHNPQDRCQNIIDYHWNDRAKLYKDYINLNTIFELNLVALGVQLNHSLKVELPPKFWRILVGPWLLNFIAVTFDRWSTIQKLKNEYPDVWNSVHLDEEVNFKVAKDFDEFDLFSTTDTWNGQLFNQIVAFEKNDKVAFLKKTNSWLGEKNAGSCSTGILEKGSNRSWIKRALSILGNLALRANNVLIYRSQLGWARELKLHAMMMQIPFFELPGNLVERSEVHLQFRDWQLPAKGYSMSTEYDAFQEFLSYVVPSNLPTAYLEDLKTKLQKSKSFQDARVPKILITNHSIINDDEFKFIAAKMVASGAKLWILQHGGAYGTSKFHSYEEFEISICDKYLSFGWGKKNQPKVEPFCFFLPKNEFNLKPLWSTKRKQNKSAKVMGLHLPRYSVRLFAGPLSCVQYRSYLDDLKKYFSHLNVETLNEHMLRLYKNAPFEQEEVAFLRERVAGLQFEFIEQQPSLDLQSMKLAIHTYNGTTLLESLFANVPTIIFWNEKHHELNNDATKLFEVLEAAGIYFRCPIEAAQHVSSIWDSIDDWWLSPKVQDARRHFCYSHLRTEKRPVSKLFARINRELKKNYELNAKNSTW